MGIRQYKMTKTGERGATPYVSGGESKFVSSFALTGEQNLWLVERSRATGRSKSALVRELIDAEIKRTTDANQSDGDGGVEREAEQMAWPECRG